MLYNKNRFCKTDDKKLLRKIGKHWVTVSVAMLALLGGGMAISSVSAHADTETPQIEVNNPKPSMNNSLPNGSSITKRAKNMRMALWNSANVKTRPFTNTNKGSSSVASQNQGTKSFVNNSTKPTYNTAYEQYLRQNPQLVQAYNNGNSNLNGQNQVNKPEHNIGDSNYFSGGVKSTGVDCGLNYIAYNNGGVEFTGGVATNDLSMFDYEQPNITNAKSIKFDDNINLNNVTNMNGMFAYLNIVSLDLGNNFSTGNVTNMSDMFKDMNNLQSIVLPNSFNTDKVTNMNEMFLGDGQLHTLILPDHFNTKTVESTSSMFQYDYSLKEIVIKSSNTIFNIGMDLYSDHITMYEKDNNDNYTSDTPTELSDEKSHIGTFVTTENPHYVTDHINFNGDSRDNITQSGVYGERGNVLPPDGYHFTDVVNGTFIYGYDNGTHTFDVAPNVIKDTINYRVNNDHSKYSEADSLVNTQTITTSATDTLSSTVSSADNPYVPLGYTMSPTVSVSHTNIDELSSDNVSDTVWLTPNPDNVTLDFKNNDKSISASTYNGYVGNKASITPPRYYNFSTNQSNNLTYAPNSNNSYSSLVNVTPSQASATVQYQVNANNVANNGSSMPSFTSNGNYYLAPSASDTSFNATSKSIVPAGYHMLSGQIVEIPFDNDNHVIQVAPNTITDTVNYQVVNDAAYAKAKQVLSTERVTLNTIQASGAGYYSSKVASSGNPYVPAGYHMLSNIVTVGNHSSNATDTINIAPDAESMTVNFSYDGNDSVTSSAVYRGYMGGTFTVSAPRYYSINSASSTFSYGDFANGRNSMTMPVTPDRVNQTIDYKYNGSNEGSTVMNGTYKAQSSANRNGMYPGWHLANDGTQKFTFNAGSTNVNVVPNTIEDTIKYQISDNNSYGSQANSFLPQTTLVHLNDVRTSVGNYNYNVTSVPNGNYHVASNATSNFSHSANSNGTSVTNVVLVAPDSESENVHYSYSGHSLSSANISGGYYDSTGTVTSAPVGWALSNNDNSFTFGLNNNSINVNVDPSSVAYHIKYMANGSNVSDANYVFSSNDYMSSADTVSGYTNNHFNLTSANLSEFPKGYQLISANNPITYNADNSTYNVDVMPKSESAAIIYTDQNGHKYYGRVNGVYGQKINNIITANGNNLPDGYSVNSGQDGSYIFNDSLNQTKSLSITGDYQSDTMMINIQKYNGNGSEYRGHNVKTVILKGKTGNSFTINPNDYLPSNYRSESPVYTGKFTGKGLNASKVTFKYDAVISTITVNYINKNNNAIVTKQIDSKKITKPFTPFDIDEYMSEIPNGYEYAGIHGDVDNFGNDNHTVNIYLTKVPNPQVAQSTITINYVDKGTKRFIARPVTVKGDVSAPFNIDEYLTSEYLPSGYEYNGVKAINPDSDFDDSSFDYKNNVIDVFLTKEPKRTITQSTITVDYVNQANNQIVKSEPVTKAVSTDFDVKDYINNLPHGYKLMGVKDGVNQFDYDSHTVKILLGKLSVTPKKSQAGSNTSQATNGSASNKSRSSKAASSSANQTSAESATSSSAPNHNNNSESSVVITPASTAMSTAVSSASSIAISSVNYETSLTSEMSLSTNAVGHRLAMPIRTKRIRRQVRKTSLVPVHYRYVLVIKALQLHTQARFTKHNGVRVIKSGHEFYIERVVKDHGYIRYVVRYHHKNYYITANSHYVRNLYLQKEDFRKHNKAVRVIKAMNEYRQPHFTKYSRHIHHFRRGSILPVKRVITITKGRMTRLVLTNGCYVTSNKKYVMVIR